MACTPDTKDITCDIIIKVVNFLYSIYTVDV